MSKTKVNCDTRVDPEIKEKLEKISKRLGIKRADLQRAAFRLIIEKYEELLDEQEKK